MLFDREDPAAEQAAVFSVHIVKDVGAIEPAHGWEVPQPAPDRGMRLSGGRVDPPRWAIFTVSEVDVFEVLNPING